MPSRASARAGRRGDRAPRTHQAGHERGHERDEAERAGRGGRLQVGAVGGIERRAAARWPAREASRAAFGSCPARIPATAFQRHIPQASIQSCLRDRGGPVAIAGALDGSAAAPAASTAAGTRPAGHPGSSTGPRSSTTFHTRKVATLAIGSADHRRQRNALAGRHRAAAAPRDSLRPGNGLRRTRHTRGAGTPAARCAILRWSRAPIRAALRREPAGARRRTAHSARHLPG